MLLLTSFKRRDMPESPPPGSSTRFATAEVMGKIRHVIRHAHRPTWFNSVPYKFGDAGTGRLKADEWRLLSTVYLPIALVLLWGEGSRPARSSQATLLRTALDHSMHLSQAVLLACTRTTSRAAAHAYRDHLAIYIKDLKTVHPDATYKCNHHMSMHIYDFLLAFGPVVSWWCFPFERLIGMLQKMPTSDRHGELFAWS
jgi:hypothetical protein